MSNTFQLVGKPETSVLRKSFSKLLYFRGVILTRLRQYPRHIRVVTSRSQISARGEGQEKSASVNCCTVLCNAVYSVQGVEFYVNQLIHNTSKRYGPICIIKSCYTSWLKGTRKSWIRLSQKYLTLNITMPWLEFLPLRNI